MSRTSTLQTPSFAASIYRPHASLRSRDPFTCLPPPRPTPVVAAAAVHERPAPAADVLKSHLVVADTPHNELEATLVRVVMATAGACNDRAVLRSAACAQHGIVLDVCRYVLDCQVRARDIDEDGMRVGGDSVKASSAHPSPAVTLGLLSRQTAELIATQTSAPSHTQERISPHPRYVAYTLTSRRTPRTSIAMRRAPS